MKTLLVSLLCFTSFLMPQAFAVGPACYEVLPDGTSLNNLCGLASGNVTQVFQSFNQPIESVLPGFALVILWGGIIGVVWFKTERIDIVGVIGIMVSATVVGLSHQVIGIGLLLLFVSLGILLFQVVRQRVSVYT